MEEIAEGKKTCLLLHSCCAPCSSAVIERLKTTYDITVFYSNPNIYPFAEYEKRKNEQARLLKILNIPFIEGQYNEEEFEKRAKGKEQEKEGGSRCEICFAYRLEPVVKYASENGFDIFATTLTVSPYKNAELVNRVGNELSKKYNFPYLESNFKKQQGYLRSLQLSKEYGLYRQNYCGCKFSLENSLKQF